MADNDKTTRPAPARPGGRPRGTGGQAKDLSTDEIRRLDRCLSGSRHEHRDRCLIALGLGSGMRIGELAGLTLGDVLDGRGEVLAEIRLEWRSTKGKRSRTVTLTRQAQLALEKWVESREGEHPSWPLFPSERWSGRHLTAKGAAGAVRRALVAAGITGASSHSLRRTHANELRRRGVDLKIIQEQLGHSSLAITERYLRIDPVEKRAAIEGMKF